MLLLREVRFRLRLLLLGWLLSVGLLLVRRSELLFVIGRLVGGDLVERSVIGGVFLVVGLSCGLGLLLIFPLVWVNVFLFTCSGLTRVEQGYLAYSGVLSSVLLVASVVAFSLFYSDVVGSLYAFRVNDLVSIESMGVVEDHYRFLVRSGGLVLLIGQLPVVVEVILGLRLVTALGVLGLRRYSLLVGVSSLAFIGSTRLMVAWVLSYEFICFKKRLEEL